MTIGDGGPYVAEPNAVRVCVRIHPLVLFKQLDNVADELVDFALVGTRSPALVLDAGELKDASARAG